MAPLSRSLTALALTFSLLSSSSATIYPRLTLAGNSTSNSTDASGPGIDSIYPVPPCTFRTTMPTTGATTTTAAGTGTSTSAGATSTSASPTGGADSDDGDGDDGDDGDDSGDSGASTTAASASGSASAHSNHTATSTHEPHYTSSSYPLLYHPSHASNGSAYTTSNSDDEEYNFVSMTTSTVYATTCDTITSCAPSVTADCDVSTVTRVYVLYTTVCPVGATLPTTIPAGYSAGGGAGGNGAAATNVAAGGAVGTGGSGAAAATGTGAGTAGFTGDASRRGVFGGLSVVVCVVGAVLLL